MFVGPIDNVLICFQASDWLIDGDDLAAFEKRMKKYKEQRGLQVKSKSNEVRIFKTALMWNPVQVDYKEW